MTFQGEWISLLLVGLVSASLGCDGGSGNDPSAAGGGEGGSGAAGGNGGGAGGLPCVAEDDGNPCTEDLCDSAAHPPLADGSPCSDGDACTQSDTCQKGVCVGADPVVCDAGVVCVAGQCLVTQCQGNIGLPGVPLVSVSHPAAVAIADVDGDGRRDLVSAHTGLSGSELSVSVALGKGDGIFAPAVEYPVAPNGDQVFTFAVADLNGDGALDIATANATPSGPVLSVLSNSGSGTFLQKAEFPLPWTALAVTAADLNGDGRVDLALASHYSSAVGVRLNDGTGAFPTQTDHTAGGSIHSVTAADLNGDGQVDLATADANTVSVLVNDGSAAFSSATSYPTGQEPQTVVATDVDGDGALDLAVTSKLDGNVRVLRNDGQGLFPTSADYPAGKEPRSLEAADLNGDGKPELVVTEFPEPELHVLFNDGQGLFPTRVDHATQVFSSSVAAGDVNGDGKADLVVTCPSDLYVLQNTGSGAFAALEEHHAPSPAYFDGVTAADLDGNGALDLAAVSTDGLQVFLNDGSGALPSPVLSEHVGGTRLQAAELNGDGKLDLVLWNTTTGLGGSQVGVALNGGGGVFPTLTIPTSTAGGVAAADLNGDGLADLAVTGDDGNPLLYVQLNQGGGSFSDGVAYPTSFNPGPIAAADFNGDGQVDLAVGASSRVTVHWNVGGDFNQRTEYPVGSSRRDLITPDLDGDGRPDLVFVGESPTKPLVRVVRNEGGGNFSLPVDYPTRVLPNAVRAADMNGDGLRDLVVAYGLGDLSVLLGKGNGQFTPARDYFVGTDDWSEVQQFAVGDLNHDGRQDLAFGVGDAVQVLFNRCLP